MADRKRSYDPGRRAASRGALSPNKWAWVKIYFGQFTIWADYRKDEDDNNTDELLDLKLMFNVIGRGVNTWNLTACTEEELISLRHLLNTAIDWAMPISRQRDKDASDAFEQDDDTHSRIYRVIPQLVYRKGPVGEHRESVQRGLEDVSRLPRDILDLRPDVRDEGADLVEPDSKGSGPEDDGAATDESPSVRTVGEVDHGVERVSGTDSFKDDPASDL